MGPRVGLVVVARGRKSFLCPCLESNHDCPARSLFTIMTELHGLVLDLNTLLGEIIGIVF
jgi:hypothetical protein